jgi:hypothetical protein
MQLSITNDSKLLRDPGRKHIRKGVHTIQYNPHTKAISSQQSRSLEWSLSGLLSSPEGSSSSNCTPFHDALRELRLRTRVLLAAGRVSSHSPGTTFCGIGAEEPWPAIL